MDGAVLSIFVNKTELAQIKELSGASGYLKMGAYIREQLGFPRKYTPDEFHYLEEFDELYQIKDLVGVQLKILHSVRAMRSELWHIIPPPHRKFTNDDTPADEWLPKPATTKIDEFFDE